MESFETFLLPDGYFGPYDQNELQLVSEISDPPKFRFGVIASALREDDYNLGTLSANLVRDDGRHEEYVELKLALAPNRGEGALRIQVRRAGSETTEEVLYVDAHQIVSRVPISAPNFSADPAQSNELRAPGGVYWLVIQASDGNVVAYKNSIPYDYSTGVPYWSSGTVHPQVEMS